MLGESGGRERKGRERRITNGKEDTFGPDPDDGFTVIYIH